MENTAEVMALLNLSDEEWDSIPSSIQAKLVDKLSAPQYYVLGIHGDVEPELLGPFDTSERQDEVAKESKKANTFDDGGIYPVVVSPIRKLNIDAYSGGFFMDEES